MPVEFALWSLVSFLSYDMENLLLLLLLLSHFSRVWLLATPWTAAYQAPPSMGFSRQEYWTGVPSPSPWTVAGASLHWGTFSSCSIAVLVWSGDYGLTTVALVTKPYCFWLSGHLLPSNNAHFVAKATQQWANSQGIQWLCHTHYDLPVSCITEHWNGLLKNILNQNLCNVAKTVLRGMFIAILPQETRKTLNRHLILYLKQLEKEEQKTPQN